MSESVSNEPTIGSTNPNIQLVYPKPIELLDESEHHSTVELTKKLNEALKEINRLKK